MLLLLLLSFHPSLLRRSKAVDVFTFVYMFGGKKGAEIKRSEFKQKGGFTSQGALHKRHQRGQFLFL